MKPFLNRSNAYFFLTMMSLVGERDNNALLFGKKLWESLLCII